MFPRGQEEAEDGLFLVKVYYYYIINNMYIINNIINRYTVITLLRYYEFYDAVTVLPSHFLGQKVSNVYFPLFLFSAFSVLYVKDVGGLSHALAAWQK